MLQVKQVKPINDSTCDMVHYKSSCLNSLLLRDDIKLRGTEKTGRAVMSSGLVVLCLLLLLPGAFGFGVQLFDLFEEDSFSHEKITERAILNTTVQVCRAVALAEGKDFTFPPPPFTAESVAAACQASKSSKSFHQTIKLIRKKNRRIDYWHVLDAEYHFDDEKFAEGRKIITYGLPVVKASIARENFESAREKLGQILHTLQDFYSHSNWVELENKLPNSNLIRSDTSIGNIAAESRATCRNCDGDDCRNNILEDILRENILTSGYFGFLPRKPKGKCSHGNFLDVTSLVEPKGGINKDRLGSIHGHLHIKAANVAIAATSELLEDVRAAAGDKRFLQMIGISTGSSKALCFVIDTTGSMGDDIAAIKNVTSSIINSKVGTENAPSEYILVPFNDPDFGPLMRTTDPEVFKAAINSLSATGGGDLPDMSLSGLQLALTGAPPNSEIFLFTDATAKDQHLRSTVIALIERTKSEVNFMFTGFSGFRRRRQSGNNQEQRQQQQSSQRVTSDFQLYKNLADVSGGQAIEVTKSELPAATIIIIESSSSSLVTLLQAARSPGKAENFTFTVDESVRNLTIYITGRSVTFTLISPSGVPQSTTSTGSLITASQSVGNFKTLNLKAQVGLWEIKMASSNPYTLKVVGDSPIDFLFDFLEDSQGPLGGLDVADNRPRAGVNGSLLATVIGSDSIMVTEVILVKSSGSGEVNGSVVAQGGGDVLVRFDRIPSEEFVVLIKGQNSNGSSKSSPAIFQRQSGTSITASALTVTVDDSNSVLAPGTPLSVPFSVMTNGVGGNYRIQATNDQGFALTFPSNLSLETGGSANSTVNITAPLNTTSGTDVTLTIQAEAPGGTDTNYVVMRFTVLTTVTDFTKPVCELLSLQSSCSENCRLSMWELSVQVTDGAEGTGVDRVSLRQGNGTVNTSLAAGNESVTLVSYSASCCSPDVELVVVDGVGNVGSCFYTVRKTATISSRAVNENTKIPSSRAVNETTTTTSSQAVNETTTTPSSQAVNETSTTPSLQAVNKTTTTASSQAVNETTTTTSSQTVNETSTTPSSQAVNETTTTNSSQTVNETSTTNSSQAVNETTTTPSSQAVNETTTTNSSQAVNETSTTNSSQTVNETTTTNSSQAVNETSTTNSSQAVNETTTTNSSQAVNETSTTNSSQAVNETSTTPSSQTVNETTTTNSSQAVNETSTTNSSQTVNETTTTNSSQAVNETSTTNSSQTVNETTTTTSSQTVKETTTTTTTSSQAVKETTTTNTPQTPTPVSVVSLSSKTVQSFLLCLSITILGLGLPFAMGIN